MGTMARYWKLVMASTVLWTIVGSLAVVGTVYNDLRMLLWAVLVAAVACMASSWLIGLCAASLAVSQERIRMETLAEIMAAAASDARVERLR